MTSATFGKTAPLLLLGILAVLMGVWVKLPGPAVGGLAILHASLLGLALFPPGAVRERCFWVAVAALVAVPVAVAWSCAFFTFDDYYVALAGLNAAAVLWVSWATPADRPDARGRLLALGWATLGLAVFLTQAYLENWPVRFHVGLGIAFSLLVWVLHSFRPGRFLFQAVATLILLVVGLPVVDWICRPVYHNNRTAALSRSYYSYAAARKDPAAFAQWWSTYLKEWDAMAGQLFERDPSGKLPFRLRPDSQGKFFESTMVINGKGLRGPAIPEVKGNAYRILALGESTTFGCTLRQEDRPWPEVLEELIREQLKPARPVQVLNAGVPAYNLRHNLARLRDELLALEPDMVVSYHGINGFFLLDAALPRASGPPPPAFRPRPLRLLADSEYRFKLLRYRRRQADAVRLHPPDLSDPLRTDYAKAYRELIALCQDHGIRLALGNFSLAVNMQSSLDVAEFYRTAAPSVHWIARANAAHSALVQQLVAQSNDVVFVDTHPGLDGLPEQFIDLGHFTQTGREQLAANIFRSIRAVLEGDLRSE